MTYIIWNVRGLNDPGKCKKIAETFHKQHPSIIALSETKKQDFSPSCLQALAWHGSFLWNWVPYIGTAGGILLGYDDNLYEGSNWIVGKYSLGCSLRNRQDNF